MYEINSLTEYTEDNKAYAILDSGTNVLLFTVDQYNAFL